ncbi:hypothetical protein ATN84_02900 [Paramesorhizobium deserti]|uniref:DUF924 domain-containing protein n=1 Tax=Paramesorhizobium deserti TaxID=1494590 RepID=A0A135HZV0_9HYPH|nr:DUF924 family protein [Paramesorhizobium deserti]KXF78740.1 hypothetical protein ATN84_02900 [Paramesorhizobium deserti]
MDAKPGQSWKADILNFWFGELGPKQWFESTPELDHTIRTRFFDLHETIARQAAEDPAALSGDADTALAAIIALDQFPRNIFRGTARAFATDPLALAIARYAVDKGLHHQLPSERRAFLYLPFEHSEDLRDQERSVELFTAAGEEEGIKYAVEHRDIITRFGRFPHRNGILNRASTPEEEAFLLTHEGYGQTLAATEPTDAE